MMFDSYDHAHPQHQQPHPLARGGGGLGGVSSSSYSSLLHIHKSSGSHSEESKKLHKLERGWFSGVIDTRAPSKHLRKLTPDQKQLEKLVYHQQHQHPPQLIPSTAAGGGGGGGGGRKKKKAVNCKTPYQSITETFGFQHHTGSDRSLELKVIKALLQRESLLLILNEICTSRRSNQSYELQNDQKTGILDYMIRLRECTCEVIEMICLWRKSIITSRGAGLGGGGGSNSAERAFRWENRNYILKMVSDLDFLADVAPLVEALGISSDKMIHNPLMLPETLSIDKLSQSPDEWALIDANGDSSSALFKERLRLRQVEAIMLKEMELNQRGEPSIEWTDSMTYGDPADGSIYQQNINNNALEADQLSMDIRRSDLLDWYDQAQVQLQALNAYKGEMLNMDHTSTKRMEIKPSHSQEDGFGTKYLYSPSELNEPTPLTKIAELWSPQVVYRYKEGSKSPKRSGSSSKMRALRGLPKSNSNSSAADIEVLAPPVVHPPNLEQRIMITEEHIKTAIQLEFPSKGLVLAGGAILIILADGYEIPGDITWQQFCSVASSTEGFHEKMNAVQPSELQQFKTRALLPFIKDLQLSVEEQIDECALYLIQWVIQMLHAATNESSPQAPQPQTQPSDEAALGVKNKPTSSSANFSKSRKEIPPHLKILHVETLPGPKQSPVEITFIGPKGNLNSQPLALQRFLLQAFDVASQEEAEVAINLREYCKFEEDMKSEFQREDLSKVYQPRAPLWWSENLRNVVVLKRVEGKLVVRISKPNIKSLVKSLLPELPEPSPQPPQTIQGESIELNEWLNSLEDDPVPSSEKQAANKKSPAPEKKAQQAPVSKTSSKSAQPVVKKSTSTASVASTNSQKQTKSTKTESNSKSKPAVGGSTRSQAVEVETKVEANPLPPPVEEKKPSPAVTEDVDEKPSPATNEKVGEKMATAAASEYPQQDDEEDAVSKASLPAQHPLDEVLQREEDGEEGDGDYKLTLEELKNIVSADFDHDAARALDDASSAAADHEHGGDEYEEDAYQDDFDEAPSASAAASMDHADADNPEKQQVAAAEDAAPADKKKEEEGEEDQQYEDDFS